MILNLLFSCLHLPCVGIKVLHLHCAGRVLWIKPRALCVLANTELRPHPSADAFLLDLSLSSSLVAIWLVVALVVVFLSLGH